MTRASASTENEVKVSRAARSATMKFPECPTRLHELSELREFLNDQYFRPKSGYSTLCEVSKSSNDCENLISLIQCGIEKFRVKNDEISKNVASLGEIVILRHVVDDMIGTSQDSYTNYGKQKTLPEHKREVDKLYTKMNEVVNLLKISLEYSIRRKIKLCAFEVSNGNIRKAVDEFYGLKDFKDYENISEIVKKAYSSYGGLKNFENIIEFIGRLPWIANVIGYQSFYDVMHEHQHLNTEKTFLLAEAIHKLEPNSQSMKQEEKEKFQDLQKKINLGVENILNAWQAMIQSKQKLVNFEFGDHSSVVFQKYFGKFMKKFYMKDVNNAEKILPYVDNLKISEGALLLTSLHEEMKQNNHLYTYQLTMFAYKLKKFMEKSDYQTIEKSMKDKITTLKDNLNKSVRNLVWTSSDNCTIRSHKYNEYLYAAAHSRNYRVYSWNEDQKEAPYDAYWVIYSFDNGKTFKIYNTYMKRYIVCDDWKHNDQERYLYTKWHADIEHNYLNHYWKIVPGKENVNLINVYGEVMYVDDHTRSNSYRQYVFTRISGSLKTAKSGDFEIYCE